ncbi:hypothetical protein [Marinobacter sp.]|uniref:hypothetical protein n=1 Tax=Marinobacter sp. TaxID=50741 RepID=UPI003A95B2B5
MNLSLFDTPANDQPPNAKGDKVRPVVRSDHRRLVERGGNGQTGIFDTEHYIVWVRESEAAVRLSHGGKAIATLSTWVDRGHYLDCIETAVDAFQGALTNFSVTRTSTLDVGIYLSLIDVPHVSSKDAHGATCLKALEHNRWYSADAQGGSTGDPLANSWVMENNQVLSSISLLRHKDRSIAHVCDLVTQLRLLAGAPMPATSLSDRLQGLPL